jgi:hypothetical protein
MYLVVLLHKMGRHQQVCGKPIGFRFVPLLNVLIVEIASLG